MRPRLPNLCLILPWVLWSAACSTGPSVNPEYEFPPGDRVEVVYSDGVTKLSLRNVSSLPAERAYRPGADQNLKVTDDESMSRLMTDLDNLGFFEAAQPSAFQQAKATIELDWNGRRYVRSRMPAAFATPEDLEGFNHCANVFRFVYNETRSYHPSQLRKKDFEKLNKHLQREAAERIRERR